VTQPLVTQPRRRVRATPEFFQALDRLLPSERGGGRPSRADFQSLELLHAVDRQVRHGLRRPPPELIPGRSDYRILISGGSLVTAFTEVGQLASDGSVELVDLDIDLNPPPQTEEPP
jgi:hypothetical protein